MDAELSYEERERLYKQDPRIPCKYQYECYQRNPEHREKFKHPPKKPLTTNGNKRKVDDVETVEEKESITSKQVKIEQENKNQSTNIQQDEGSESTAVKNINFDEDDVKNDVNMQSSEIEDMKKIQDEQEHRENSQQWKSLTEEFCQFRMPDGFFKFYEFCRLLKPKDPINALSDVGLTLVGPYDILDDSKTKEELEKYDFLLHWRYFYDPPEFQTVLKGNPSEGYHFGYWRDIPSELPVFIVSNRCNVSCKIKQVAENVFGAVEMYLEEKLKSSNPFERNNLSNILLKLRNHSKKENIKLSKDLDKIKARNKKVVAKTFHETGVVSPYNKKNQLGYRPLSVTDDELRKILMKIEKEDSEDDLQKARGQLAEIIRLATIAGDECDFGTCLELAHDLFSSGVTQVQDAALGMFAIAYNELDRKIFFKIIEKHLQNRKKVSHNLSAFKSE